ncbi:Cytosolic carboxypeptidase 6 [Larimichthys crocea]|uniref:Uncharacterized protein n=1 Tax=Larimichthys crocea TaxID=215358 RepID=A0ACD3RN57_LARCR|nr:Cytosolic carboxypeptidase 6 [Larimichthys crocea]
MCTTTAALTTDATMSCPLPSAFDREDDVYQFAYCYPYTYSRLQHYLASLERRNLPYLQREQLGLSVQQRRLDLLTITNSGKSLTSYDSTFANFNTTPPLIYTVMLPEETQYQMDSRRNQDTVHLRAWLPLCMTGDCGRLANPSGSLLSATAAMRSSLAASVSV